MRPSKTFSALSLTILLITACGEQATEPLPVDRMLVENDETVLNQRMQYVDEDVAVEPARESGTLVSDGSHSTIRLVLRAEMPPPAVDGHPTRASHVTFDNKRAYVSYHTRFNTYRGGVEIIDIERVGRPRLKSQALFRDTDVTIAQQFDGRLFLGEATNSDMSDEFDSPACLEVIELRASQITKNTTRVDMPSFNANDIACFDSTIFVTAGTSDGYLATFPTHGTAIARAIPIPGAKAVERNRQYVFILEGTGTRLHVFERGSLNFVKVIDLGCENEFQTKAEMDVAGNRVYISAGECGLLVVDVDQWRVTNPIPAPPGGTTNAVSLSEDLLFLANGMQGLVVVKIARDRLETIGTARFDGSTNYVAANGNTLFVANGSGGLKILEIVR